MRPETKQASSDLVCIFGSFAIAFCLVYAHIIWATAAMAEDTNKKNYREGDIVVDKNYGQLAVVKSNWVSDADPEDIRVSVVFLQPTAPGGKKLQEFGTMSTYPAFNLERLQLDEPKFDIYFWVINKKTKEKGQVLKRHQGFNRWTYTVRIDKDFEDYDKTRYDRDSDPRKIKEWNEQDIDYVWAKNKISKEIGRIRFRLKKDDDSWLCTIILDPNNDHNINHNNGAIGANNARGWLEGTFDVIDYQAAEPKPQPRPAPVLVEEEPQPAED